MMVLAKLTLLSAAGLPTRRCTIFRESPRSPRTSAPTLTRAARWRPYSSSPGSSSRSPQAQPAQTKERSRVRKDKEQFDMELAVLFGLPTLILLLPWVASEPQSWALFAPLLLFIPGPRDIARSILSNVLQGVSQGKGEAPAWPAPQPRAGQAPPPPPPQNAFRRWPFKAADNIAQPAEQVRQPRSGPSSAPSSSAPAAGPYWSPPQPDWAPAPASYEAPAKDSSGPASVVPYAGRWEVPVTRSAGPPGPAVGEMWGGSGQPSRAVATAAVGGGRVVRSAGRGRVGIDVGPGASGVPFIIRALLSAMPFLKSWGGFV